jgi:hypothetical protein
METGAERFLRALSGETARPPVAGISFVAPDLLEQAGGAESGGGPSGGPGGGPAATLAAAAIAARLDFVFVPAWESWAADAVAALADAGVACVWVVPGVLWPSLEATGVATGLRAAATDPSGLADLLEDALAHALRAAARGVRSGVSAIAVADDLAGSSGPMVDPAFLRAAVFPRLSQVADAAVAAGMPALLHCDGDARTLMTMIATAGFVGIHGDAGGGRFFEGALAAARLAGLVTLGGISAAALGDPSDANAAAARAFALSDGGGLIVADDGGAATVAEARALLGALARSRGI